MYPLSTATDNGVREFSEISANPGFCSKISSTMSACPPSAANINALLGPINIINLVTTEETGGGEEKKGREGGKGESVTCLVYFRFDDL